MNVSGRDCRSAVECRALKCKRMRRGIGIDSLTREDVKLVDSLAQTFELRQMRVSIESADSLKNP